MDLFMQARERINEIDEEMARLFERRMQAARTIAQYKSENGLPVCDPVREEQILKQNAAQIEDAALRSYYESFFQHCMALSREYQEDLIAKNGELS